MASRPLCRLIRHGGRFDRDAGFTRGSHVLVPMAQRLAAMVKKLTPSALGITFPLSLLGRADEVIE